MDPAPLRAWGDVHPAELCWSGLNFVLKILVWWCACIFFYQSLKGSCNSFLLSLKLQKFGELQQHDFFLWEFWKSKVWNKSVGRAAFLLGAPISQPFPLLEATGILWLVVPSLSHSKLWRLWRISSYLLQFPANLLRVLLWLCWARSGNQDTLPS